MSNVTQRWAAVAVSATLAWTGIAPAAQAATPTEVVQANRTSYVAKLTPYLNCITKKSAKDTYSPLFYGCYDWHSAVHAHWALFASTSMTGNTTYAQQATTSLKPSLVSSELSYMQRKTVTEFTNNPYGFAWLTRLARERQQLNGDTSLRPLADYAAQEAVKFPRSSVSTAEYRNSSFAAIQLWEWATFTGNVPLQNQVRAYVDANIRPWECTLASDAATTGFFAPCAMRMAAIATIDGSASAAWVNQQAQGYTASYRSSFPTPHAKALNFTTAYALARAGKVAGNTALVDNAASLVNQQMPNSGVYAGTYTESHWIPQLGILAIQTITT